MAEHLDHAARLGMAIEPAEGPLDIDPGPIFAFWLLTVVAQLLWEAGFQVPVTAREVQERRCLRVRPCGLGVMQPDAQAVPPGTVQPHRLLQGDFIGDHLLCDTRQLGAEGRQLGMHVRRDVVMELGLHLPGLHIEEEGRELDDLLWVRSGLLVVTGGLKVQHAQIVGHCLPFRLVGVRGTLGMRIGCALHRAEMPPLERASRLRCVVVGRRSVCVCFSGQSISRCSVRKEKGGGEVPPAAATRSFKRRPDSCPGGTGSFAPEDFRALLALLPRGPWCCARCAYEYRGSDKGKQPSS